MTWLITRIWQAAVALAESRGVQVGLAGAAVADILNIDVLRQMGVKAAPGSDQAAIEEAARSAARLLNLSGDEVLWPRHRKGPLAGQPITPSYLIVSLGDGRAWYASKYNSYNTVKAANSRGFRNGLRSGKNQGLRETQAYAKP